MSKTSLYDLDLLFELPQHSELNGVLSVRTIIKGKPTKPTSCESQPVCQSNISKLCLGCCARVSQFHTFPFSY